MIRGGFRRRQIAELKRMPEAAIDFSDIPELSTKGLRRVNPARLAVELDPDVTAWIESLGKRAKTRVNSILRAAMKAGK